ncbi:MAG TPA: hypothetical protein VE979_21990 [Streptosporangiaceae bacterium]|jgi:hypothetical protein|nr:hypothetical protein [Streptosporangiaceae bacterium]
MTQAGDKVARRAALGTIVGIYGQQPDWFEGDWPEEQPRAVAIIKWPGRKKLTVEPVGDLITVQL